MRGVIVVACVLVLPSSAAAQRGARKAWQPPDSWKVEQRATKGEVAWLDVRDGWLFWVERKVVAGTESNRVQAWDVALFRRQLDKAAAEHIANVREVGGLPHLHPGASGELVWDSRGRDVKRALPGKEVESLELLFAEQSVAPAALMPRGLIGKVYPLKGSPQLVAMQFDGEGREFRLLAEHRALEPARIKGSQGKPVQRHLGVDGYATPLADKQRIAWQGEIGRSDTSVAVAATVVWDRSKQREAWWHAGSLWALSSEHVYSQAPQWNDPETPWIVRRQASDGAEAVGWREAGAPSGFLALGPDHVVAYFIERQTVRLGWYDLKAGRRGNVDFGFDDGARWSISTPARPGALSMLQLPGGGHGLLYTDAPREQFFVAVGEQIYRVPLKLKASEKIDVEWKPYEGVDDRL